MSHSDVSCRGFLKSTSIIAIAAGAFASASVLLAKVAASSVAIMGCQNTDTRQLIREPFQLFDYVPERSQVIRDSKLEEETTQAPEPSTKLVRSRSFDAHPLSIDEAMMQIDLLDNAFLVFVNAETNHINVLYRLDADDGFGLVDTGSAIGS